MVTKLLGIYEFLYYFLHKDMERGLWCILHAKNKLLNSVIIMNPRIH